MVFGVFGFSPFVGNNSTRSYWTENVGEIGCSRDGRTKKNGSESGKIEEKETKEGRERRKKKKKD